MFPYTNSSSSTTLEAPSSPFLPISLFFLDDDDDGLVSHLLSQHHSLSMINNAPAAAAATDDYQRDHEVSDHVVITKASPARAATTNMIISNGGGGGDDKIIIPKKRRQQQQVLPRKKTGKKDRHSKIYTAHGLRDRRMRLSVKVARKFFDLQDMLDFDKASKTIEWLLINSSAAIQELAARSQLQQLPDWNHNGHEKSMSSSASMSEVVSETNKEMEIMQTGEESVAAKPKRKRRKSCKAAISVNPLARESRDMARARARERTREKMMIQRSHNTQSTDQSITRLEAGEDSGFTHAIGDHMGATRIEPTAGCYAMTSKKPSLGNPQVQNMNQNLQGHNNKLPSTSPPSSIFMTISNNRHWSNPSSFFVSAPNTQDHQQNPIPNPNFMSSAPNTLEGITNSAFSATSSNIGFESHGFMSNQFQ